MSNYFRFSNWYGDNAEYNEKTGKGDLGVGIFSNSYCITLQYYHNKNIRYFILFKVFNNEENYTIYAVWAKKEKCNFPYIGQVIKGLKEKEYKTVVMIAHRLKTIKNVDQILVVNEERIQERSTHREPLEHNDLYAHLWNLQNRSKGVGTEAEGNT